MKENEIEQCTFTPRINKKRQEENQYYQRKNSNVFRNLYEKHKADYHSRQDKTGEQIDYEKNYERYCTFKPDLTNAQRTFRRIGTRREVLLNTNSQKKMMCYSKGPSVASSANQGEPATMANNSNSNCSISQYFNNTVKVAQDENSMNADLVDCFRT